MQSAHNESFSPRGHMSLQKSMKIDVVLAPDLLSVTDMKDSLYAVIDVLRATTTITAALGNGASRVIPFMNATGVLAKARSLPQGSYLLGGEEKSLKIPGFDLGNSPLEYTDVVKGKTILFSTTNGTPTMRKTFQSSGHSLYLAALVNISAVSEAMVKEAENGTFSSLIFVCSGRYGKPSSEDTFCAGLGVQKVSRILSEKEIAPELGDSALIAAHFAWSNQDSALTVLRACEHGRSLLALGFDKDLEFAADIDKFAITPVFNGEEITAR